LLDECKYLKERIGMPLYTLVDLLAMVEEENDEWERLL